MAYKITPNTLPLPQITTINSGQKSKMSQLLKDTGEQPRTGNFGAEVGESGQNSKEENSVGVHFSRLPARRQDLEMQRAKNKDLQSRYTNSCVSQAYHQTTRVGQTPRSTTKDETTQRMLWLLASGRHLYFCPVELIAHYNKRNQLYSKKYALCRVSTTNHL